MQANELRIGNWVKLISKDKFYEISTGYDIDEGTESEDFQPIPFTEEWLLRLGFEQEGDFYSLNYKGVYFSSLIPFNEVVSQSYHETTIEFVHQLQNFYFALCGEELTTN